MDEEKRVNFTCPSALFNNFTKAGWPHTRKAAWQFCFHFYFSTLFMAKNTPANRKEESQSMRNPHDADTLPAIAGLKFEAALAELEQLVRRMEDGRLPLEESIAAYRRGNALLGHCQHLLQDAEQKIQVLENGTLRDFDTHGDAQ